MAEWSGWTGWRDRRETPEVVHLDTASAGRGSRAVVDAVTDHLRAEARSGAYAAQAAAGAQVEEARAALARLLGTDPGGVALTESATASLERLLGAWPLPPGARVGVPPAAWGPNLALLRHAGHDPVLLDVDADGVLDVGALVELLRKGGLDLLLVDQVASHRGLVQPIADVVAAARDTGVPVWVDAAQSLGHVEASNSADAVVATSRKWLTGPRGVGVLAVAAPWRDRLRTWRHPGEAGATPVQGLESREAFVGGRLGLGAAVAELEADGPALVHARLAEVGQRVRAAVDDVAGWGVVRPGSPAGAITALAPTAGQDVVEVRRRLLVEHGLLTTAGLPWRAPEDPHAVPSLRVSPHVDLADDDLERLVTALHAHRR